MSAVSTLTSPREKRSTTFLKRTSIVPGVNCPTIHPYLIRNESHLLGAIGMGAAAWKVAPRDLFIGWTPGQREQHLHLIINQARFLILPWVRVKNLTSSVLGLLATQVVSDWEDLYGYRPLVKDGQIGSGGTAGARQARSDYGIHRLSMRGGCHVGPDISLNPYYQDCPSQFRFHRKTLHWLIVFYLAPGVLLHQGLAW